MPVKKDEVKSTSKAKGVVKLTEKQKRFVEEYLIDLNATQAAIRAGYAEKAANREGSRLLSNVDIQAAIQKAQNKRSERVQISQDDVLRGLLEVVAMSTGKKLVTETVVTKSETGEAIGTDVIKSCFEPHAANKALELLGKHLGMFTQKVDMTSSDGSMALGSLRDLFSDDTKAD